MSELSPITKAILSRNLEVLDSCVKQNSKSVLQRIFRLNLPFLSVSWPEGLKYLMTTEAKTIIDDHCYGFTAQKQPVTRALQLEQFHSVDILLGAGCYLDIDRLNNRIASSMSIRMGIIIASHIASRRTELLKIAQQKLGMYLDHTSVAFADSAAAKICAALDASQILVHPSLRVDPGYMTIYSQRLIPLNVFNCFWERGFKYFEGHDCVGFTPIMKGQYRWEHFVYSSNNTALVETLNWLSEKGFMQEKATDPLKLGLNVFATGYHYLGALFSRYALRYSSASDVVGEISRILKGPWMSQASKDDCECWCNAEGHGCSPTKLFLITYLHEGWEREPETRFSQYLMLHPELFDNASGSDNVSYWTKETLRLLTFEALEMNHTCCCFDEFDEHDPCGLTYDRAEGDKGIFCPDPDSVSDIRSCAIEQSRAALLDELMAEFTEQILSIAPGPRAFERFIYTYWRRRISGLYAPDPNAVEGFLRHQTFQGLGVSHNVRTGEYSTERRIEDVVNEC